MHIIVTGATGFLGQELCQLLLKQGFQVTALGRNQEKGQKLTQLGCRFIAIDISDSSAVNCLKFENANAIVHAAALSSAWAPKEEFYFSNVVATRNILALAQKIEASKFIFISSPSVYFQWQDQMDIDENFLLPPPINAYAKSKRHAEKLVLAQAGFSSIILRPRAIYGANDTALLPRLMRAARKGPLPLLRKGIAVTNLTHVEDVSQSILAALLIKEPLPQRIFNIAGNESLAIRDIVEQAAMRSHIKIRWKKIPLFLARPAVKMIESLSAIQPSYPEPAITSYGLGIFAYSQTLNTNAAKTFLHFTPKINFREGLDKTFSKTDIRS